MGRSMFSLALNVAPFLLETIFYVGDPRRETEVKLMFNILLIAMQWLLYYDWEPLYRQLTIIRKVIWVQSVLTQSNFILTGLAWYGSFLCNYIGFGLMIEEFKCPLPIYIEFATRLWLVLQLFQRMIVLSGTTTKRRIVVKDRGRRKKSGVPWFGRRKKSIQTQTTIRSTDSWLNTPEEWFDEWFMLHRHRYLHRLHFGKHFDQVCRLCPDFNLMLGLGFGLQQQSVFYGETGFIADSVGITTSQAGLCGACRGEMLPADLDAIIQFKSIYAVKDDMPIVFDTGATISISPDPTDFVSWESKGNTGHVIRGIASNTNVEGIGIVRWILHDDTGRRHTIETTAYYVPDSRVRLFSPQRYLKDVGSGQFTITSEGATFNFPNTRARLTFHMDRAPLPVAQPTTSGNLKTSFGNSAYDTSYNVLHADNINLTLPQKELLAWHFRLGHFNLRWIQRLTRVREGDDEPALLTKHPKTSSCPIPQCAACRFGKAHRLPDGAHRQEIRVEKDGALKVGHLKPGDMVSIDQFVSKVRGRLPHTKGKEDSKDQYSGGTIYVDSASGYVFVDNQVSLNAAETLRGKHRFEREARECGISIKSYRGDNGVFKTKEFEKDLLARNQSIKFSGVGAHHQNGIAERAIRTISECARTMLLHAAIHWPQAVSLDLWPFAVDYAVYIWNRLPREDSGIAPLELFCGAKLDLSVLRSMKVWGCPVYVLDPTVQDGKKLPRWKPKSRRGQFLGFSKRHANTVGLIRNLTTGSISTQFHVVYDDWFTTIPSTVEMNEDEQVPTTWEDLLTFHRVRYWDEADGNPPELSDDWLDDEERNQRRERELRRRRRPAPVPRIEVEEPDPEQGPPVVDPIVDDDSDFDENDNGSVGDNNNDNQNNGPEAYQRRNPPRRLRGINRRYHDEDRFVHPTYYRPLSIAGQEMYQNFLSDFGLLNDNDAFSVGTYL
jgi:hypothetical protein